MFAATLFPFLANQPLNQNLYKELPYLVRETDMQIAHNTM